MEPETYHWAIDTDLTKKQDTNYFSPTIEDLHVGYECEVLPINESLGWEAGRLSYYSGYEGPGLYNLYPFWYTTRKGNYGRIKTMIHDFKQIRVPYLTTEQIEKEGWKFVHQGLMDTFQMFERGQNLYMHFYNQQRTITIVKGNGYTIYSGSCPSINEFRTIMKLLNIK